MNIILTSTGFENLVTLAKIIKVIGSTFEKLRMLVIPVARKYEYSQEKYLNDYINLGFKKDNIFFFDDEDPELSRNLNIDIIYVCGGNTFLLQKCLKESNFNKDIIKYVKKRSNILGSKCRNTYCNF